VPLPEQGVWSLRPSSAAEHDEFLVLSFVGDTRVLAINAEDVRPSQR
jgi:DNA damage-binding protein 1